MRNALAVVFGRKRVYSRMFLADWKPWDALTDRDLSGYLAYTDLSNYRDLVLARTCLPIAILRHPVYRAISLYDFARKMHGHFCNPLAMSSDLEEFYRIASRENPRYFRNVQTSRICGYTSADLAIEYIRTRYLAVGFTSNLGDFVRDLSGIFNWPELGITSKSSDEERYDSRITPKFRNMVLSQNEEDLLLFEAVANGLPDAFPTPPFARSFVRRMKRASNAALHLGYKLPRYRRRVSGEK